MTNILITGGAGFIGSHIQDALVKRGDNVFVLDNMSMGKIENINTKSTFFEMDLRDFDQLKQLFQKIRFDIVIHHAAQINIRHSVADPIFDLESNVLGTVRLFELIKEFEVKKVLFASSGGAIYGDGEKLPCVETAQLNPCSPYGISKLAGEKYLLYYAKQYGIKYGILRYANVYGPRQNPKGEAGVISIFFSQMMNGMNPVINGDGQQTRDYVYVEDVVQANLLMLDQFETCGVFNVGTGIETSVNDLFIKINTFFGNKFKKKYRTILSGEQLRSSLDTTKLHQTLGWNVQYDLNAGLTKLFQLSTYLD